MSLSPKSWAQYDHFFDKQLPTIMVHPECTIDERIDVVHYQLDYLIDPPAWRFSGQVAVSCIVVADSLTDIVLNVRSNLTVDSVAAPGVSWERVGDDLIIQLDRVYHSGELLVLPVYNSGSERHPDYKGLFFSSYGAGHPLVIAYTLTEPWGSAAWFVCKDDPADKADSLRLVYTVPEGYVAVGNGSLVSETTAAGLVTRTWEQNYPISTYLIFTAVADYLSWDWSCTVAGMQMPLHFEVYPSVFQAAQQDFQDLPEMVEFYSELFGPYPFVQHGYNMVSIKGWTAMEHQTCTSYGQNFIQGNNNFDSVVAHELAHQWFGDLVTCDDWGDLWLNESFATWCDALWFGHENYEGYHDRLLEMKEEYRSRQPGVESLPTWDPPLDSLFNAHTYQRGAWIIHMMRRYIGDEIFFAGLNRYLDNYSWGTATTEQFFASALLNEPRLTEDIFLSWISSSGLPLFQYGWRQEDNGMLRVLIHLAEEPYQGEYLTPFTLRLQGEGHTQDLQLLLESVDREFLLLPEFPVTAIQLDPDRDVFCDLEQLPFNQMEALMSAPTIPVATMIAPNPVQDLLIVKSSGWESLEVYDILGRLCFTLPPRDAVTELTSYYNVVSLSAGVYILRLRQGGMYSTQKFLVVR
ncbi:T9SS type A sorting domain-containing protein [bacterium]|nr:T9SS type A sorting domain-containing protein [bacterium]